MRKIAAILLVCTLVMAIMPLTAFAHGHGYGRRSAAVNRNYSLCSVDNCNTTGLHYHGDTCYYGHYLGDGHDYHQLCNVQGCTLTGVHDHDGIACFGHYAGDGHGYHNYGRGGRGYHH